MRQALAMNARKAGGFIAKTLEYRVREVDRAEVHSEQRHLDG